MSVFSSVPGNRSSPEANLASRKRGLSTPCEGDHENINPTRRLTTTDSPDAVDGGRPISSSPSAPLETEVRTIEALAPRLDSGSEEERLAREAAESEALVWRLLQEEQERAYRLQMECMRAMSAGLSEEDRQALESAIAEGVAQSTAVSEEDSLDVDAMDYEQLLELGEAMGDVRKEVGDGNTNFMAVG